MKKTFGLLCVTIICLLIMGCEQQNELTTEMGESGGNSFESGGNSFVVVGDGSDVPDGDVIIWGEGGIVSGSDDEYLPEVDDSEEESGDISETQPVYVAMPDGTEVSEDTKEVLESGTEKYIADNGEEYYLLSDGGYVVADYYESDNGKLADVCYFYGDGRELKTERWNVTEDFLLESTEYVYEEAEPGGEEMFWIKVGTKSVYYSESTGYIYTDTELNPVHDKPQKQVAKDENGNLIYHTEYEYSLEGEVEKETSFDEDGRKISEYKYVDGVLRSEYMVSYWNDQSERTIIYNENGEKTIEYYVSGDEFMRSTTYYEGGLPTHGETSNKDGCNTEEMYDSEGRLSAIHVYNGDLYCSVTKYTYMENGHIVEKIYDSDGKTLQEYTEYDEAWNVIVEESY